MLARGPVCSALVSFSPSALRASDNRPAPRETSASRQAATRRRASAIRRSGIAARPHNPANLGVGIRVIANRGECGAARRPREEMATGIEWETSGKDPRGLCGL